MMAQDPLAELAEAVVQVLTLAEKCGLANQSVDLDDPEPIRVYVGLLQEQGVQAVHVKTAASIILARTFFPRPGEFLECCLDAKAVAASIQKRAYLDSLRLGKTKLGAHILAPADRFDENGVYIESERVLPSRESQMAAPPGPTRLLDEIAPNLRRHVQAIQDEIAKCE